MLAVAFAGAVVPGAEIVTTTDSPRRYPLPGVIIRRL